MDYEIVGSRPHIGRGLKKWLFCRVQLGAPSRPSHRGLIETICAPSARDQLQISEHGSTVEARWYLSSFSIRVTLKALCPFDVSQNDLRSNLADYWLW